MSRDTEKNRIRKFVLENFSKDKGMFARDVSEAVGCHVSSACAVLREMKEEEIVTRRRTGTVWEYFLLAKHDPEEYIADKNEGIIISKKFAALTSINSVLKDRMATLKDLSSKHDLVVSCECGRNITINVNAEVVTEE